MSYIYKSSSVYYQLSSQNMTMYRKILITMIRPLEICLAAAYYVVNPR